MHGIADSLKVEGMGWVKWSIRGVFGNICLICTKAYLVPNANIRLFNPQTYFQEGPYRLKTAKAMFNREKFEFTTQEGHQMIFPYSLGGNLPLMYLDNTLCQAVLSTEMSLIFQHTNILKEAGHLLHDTTHNLSNQRAGLFKREKT